VEPETPAGEPVSPALARLLGLVAPQLGQAEPPVVGILSEDDPAELVSAVLETRADARVRTFDIGRDPSDLHVELAVHGPFDVLVEDSKGMGRADRVAAVFFHVRRDGALVLRNAGPKPGKFGRRESAQEIADLLARVVRRSLVPRRGEHDATAMGRALRSLTTDNGHVVMVKQGGARAKLREEEVGRFLAGRGPAFGRVLLERPGHAWQSPAVVNSNESDAAPEYLSTYDAPPLALREYRQVMCAPGQVVWRGNVILPETYRHNAAARLRSEYVEDVAPRFARPRAAPGGARLEGAWFHLDSEFRGHFGHAMTEQISRLWAWPEAKRAEPALKALMFVHPSRPSIEQWEYDLYGAAGIEPDDLVVVDEPVLVERLLAATPMFSHPHYVHPDIAGVYRTIGDRLVAAAPDRRYPPKVFFSRRLDRRSCHNTEEVEAFFAEFGFETVYPEDYPLSEQARMFRDADEVAGFGGSGMFTVAFAPDPKRIILVSSENYWAHNEAMMAGVLGHEVHVAWCRPDTPRAPGVKGPAVFHSPFTFDVTREGEFLRELLGSGPGSGTSDGRPG
jgi:capsular polysaccharide biosynthesis protein